MNFLLIPTLICFGLICSVSMAPTSSPRVPTLLISLDGFRADKLDTFLKENPSANINKYFVNAGVKADYMIPSFPSLTFPSKWKFENYFNDIVFKIKLTLDHFTLVTGLYMESHGNSI